MANDDMAVPEPLFITYPCDTRGCRHGFMAPTNAFVARPNRLCSSCRKITVVNRKRLMRLFFNRLAEIKTAHLRYAAANSR